MLFIERFEGPLVLCEDENKEKVTLTREEIPFNAKEGDILVLNSDGAWETDAAETKRRRKSLFLRLIKLPKG